MGMYDVELADVILHIEETVDEYTAHIVDLVDKTRIQREAAPMVVDSVNAVVVRLIVPLASKHVNFVSPPLKSSGQFGHMNGNTTHRN